VAGAAGAVDCNFQHVESNMLTHCHRVMAPGQGVVTPPAVATSWLPWEYCWQRLRAKAVPALEHVDLSEALCSLCAVAAFPIPLLQKGEMSAFKWERQQKTYDVEQFEECHGRLDDLCLFLAFFESKNYDLGQRMWEMWPCQWW
jgi:hypothetical protein